jgi:type IX secretion system PorP/SprF family membrane protein
MRRFYISFSLLTLISVIRGFGQDPQFSQFYSNPLYLAPSFAGATGGSRLCANFRDQWVALPATFMTYSFSYDHYFSPFNSGVGVLAYRDVAGTGDLGTFSLGIQYSYNLTIKRTVNVRPGLHFSYRETGLSFNQLKFVDQLMNQNPDAPSTFLPSSLDRARDVDLALSTLVYSKRIWAGTTVDHLLKPDVSLYADKETVPIKVSVYGGVELVRKGRLLKPVDETMTLAFLFKSQAHYNQLDLGVYWHKNPLVLGLWYRGIPPFNSDRGDAFVILLGYKTTYFNIGYSYDVTISNLIAHAIGSHEISVSYKFLMPRRKKRGSVPCPEF